MIPNKDGIIVSPTEPTTDRRKVWFQKGKNLFNKEDILEGYYINASGIAQAEATTFCSNYIEVDGGKTIVKTRTNWNSIGLYDKNKTFISRTATSETGQLVLPENCKYIRISDLLENLDIVQVEYGTEATEYEAYVNNAIYVKNNNGEYEEFIKKEEERSNKIEEIKITSLLNGATINNGWQNKLSRIGNLCHIELAFVPNTTNNITIYQIPENFIPKMSTIGLVMRGNLIGTAIVTASNKGQIQIQVPSNADVTWELNATWFI